MGRISGTFPLPSLVSATNTSQYSWKAAHVLVPLLLGTVLIIAFCFWEVYGAKYPMFPSRLKQAPRILALTLVITFISGANFFSIIMFWPTQAFNVYGHDPVGVGIRGIPVGFSILAGAVVVLWCLSVFRGRNKELMIASSVLMTAGRFLFPYPHVWETSDINNIFNKGKPANVFSQAVVHSHAPTASTSTPCGAFSSSPASGLAVSSSPPPSSPQSSAPTTSSPPSQPSPSPSA
jgi:hypothetical protein